MNRIPLVRRLGILMIVCCLCTQVFAQQYRMFDPDRTRTYAKNEKEFFFVEFDSVQQFGTDSVFFINRIADTIPKAGCDIDLSDTTILGNTMVMLNDADETHVFFNSANDSIFIRLHQPVDSFWVLYTYPDGSIIRATVLDRVWMTVLPETFDSVYRMRLNVYDENYILQPDSILNDRKIDIAKNYGLIEFYNFRQFPYDTTVILLRGITNPENNIVNVSSYRAFNFQPGNEFHYLTQQISTPGSEVIGTTTKEKFFVLSKEQFADSVRYTMYHALWQELFLGFGAPDTLRILDTVSVTYHYADYAFLDSIELTLLQANNFGYSDFFKYDSLYWGRAYKEVYDWFEYDAVSQCLNNPGNIYLPEQRYGDGIGIMHYKDSTGIDDFITRDLVYFQKGLEVWGEPFDFDELGVVEIQNIHASLPLQIYPNPVANELYFALPDFQGWVTLTIFDMQGKQLMQKFFSDTGSMHWDVSALSGGMYLLQVSGENAYHRASFIKN